MPFTTQASTDKVIALAKQLIKFQNKSRIFLVPLADIQKAVLLNCPDKLRIILYRRMMLRIAEKIALKNKHLAIYTGESVSQVASQTLENIDVIGRVVGIPILRPLIGFDKADIIERAQQIGTYKISILPHEDCCMRFMPKNPETRGKIEEILRAEQNIDIEKLINDASDKIEIKSIK